MVAPGPAGASCRDGMDSSYPGQRGDALRRGMGTAELGRSAPVMVTRRCAAALFGALKWLFSYGGRIGLHGLYWRSLIGWFCWPVMLPLGAVLTPGSKVGPIVLSLAFFILVMTSAVVRRLHDLGHSGRRIRPPPSPGLWLDTHLRHGEPGANRWGPPPRR